MYPCPLHLRDVEARDLAAALSPKGNTPPLQQREPHIRNIAPDTRVYTHKQWWEREREEDRKKQRKDSIRKTDCLEIPQDPFFIPAVWQERCSAEKTSSWEHQDLPD